MTSPTQNDPSSNELHGIVKRKFLYVESKLPKPPRPNIVTSAQLSFCCPSIPIVGSNMCLEKKRRSLSFK